MTSDRERCGISSLLPMSCRGRAEAFARRLHSRLTSLGSEDENGSIDETSWLANGENSVTFSQPTQTSKVNLEKNEFLDFDNIESPGSPDEFDGKDFENIINNDNLKVLHNTDCHCSEETNIKKFSNIQTDLSCNSYQERSSQCYDLCGSTDSDTKINQADVTTSSSDEKKITTCCYQRPIIVCEEITNEEVNAKLDKDVDLDNGRLALITLTPPSVDVQINNSKQNDDESEIEEPIPRVRRCSSLKTGKTPPGTPGRKKIVRFADVLGLDLADVRTFLDEIPKVPNSAYNDLKNSEFTALVSELSLNTPQKYYNSTTDKILLPLFQQPGGQPEFIDRLRNTNVCLDSAFVEDTATLTIRGIVRVRNLDFNKSVHVRYSLDGWRSFADVQAGYIENSCDGFSDKFSFIIYANNLSIGQKLEFAIRFQCKGCQHWDNNFGINYIFQCLPSTNSTNANIICTDDNCGASFY